MNTEHYVLSKCQAFFFFFFNKRTNILCTWESPYIANKERVRNKSGNHPLLSEISRFNSFTGKKKKAPDFPSAINNDFSLITASTYPRLFSESFFSQVKHILRGFCFQIRNSKRTLFLTESEDTPRTSLETLWEGDEASSSGALLLNCGACTQKA